MGIEDTGTEVTTEELDTSSEVDTSEADSVDDPETEAEDGGEYTPNYGFRFYGKDAEMEEWARPLITDKATEDRFRSLYAKSHAFETVREQLKARESDFSGVQNKYGEVESTLREKEDILDELEYRRDTDLASFFEYADVPVEKVIDFVESYLNDLKKPEAEQNRLNEARQHALRARELEKENHSFRSERETHEVERHTATFNELLDNAEVDEFAGSFDEVAGKSGAFRMAVIDHGESVFQRTGKTLSPLEAVREVYRQYKPFLSGRQGGNAFEAQPTTAPAQRKQTIPNVGGSSVRSPAKRTFTSVDELKAHHQQMVAANGE